MKAKPKKHNGCGAFKMRGICAACGSKNDVAYAPSAGLNYCSPCWSGWIDASLSGNVPRLALACAPIAAMNPIASGSSRTWTSLGAKWSVRPYYNTMEGAALPADMNPQSNRTGKSPVQTNEATISCAALRSADDDISGSTTFRASGDESCTANLVTEWNVIRELEQLQAGTDHGCGIDFKEFDWVLLSDDHSYVN